MKSKFSAVVRVKKQVLDKAEARLTLARSNLSSCENNLTIAKNALAKFDMPRSGSTSDLRQNLELLVLMRNEIAGLKERLDLAKKEVAHFEFQYKRANLDYEKMKYLEKQEFKAELKRIEHAEAVALDEFAVMKFAAKKEVVQ